MFASGENINKASHLPTEPMSGTSPRNRALMYQNSVKIQEEKQQKSDNREHNNPQILMRIQGVIMRCTSQMRRSARYRMTYWKRMSM